MFESSLIHIDRVPDNLLSNLENRDIALWIRSVPTDAASQAAFMSFLGLPWSSDSFRSIRSGAFLKRSRRPRPSTIR